MGKNDFLTPKAIANRIKAKGLQKLRWYCQMCQKQCRDENGFKCHLTSESHKRQMEVFGQAPMRVIQGYSEEFEAAFMEHLRRAHPHSRVMANVVYNEYINDRNHIHMNSTKWETLSDFVKYLGKEGKCKVDETPKGWYITLIHRDSAEELEERKRLKRERAERDEEERHTRALEEQAQRAAAAAAAGAEDGEGAEPSSHELQRDEAGAPLGFSLAAGRAPAVADERPKSRLGAGGSAAAAFAEAGGGRAAAAASQPPHKRSKLEELMEKDRLAKQAAASGSGRGAPRGSGPAPAAGAGRPAPWVRPGIVVKVMSRALKEHGYYKAKGEVLRVLDRHVAEIEMLESGDVVRVDEAELETVIPQPGGAVLVVAGAHAGAPAELLAIDTGRYKAEVRLREGPRRGERAWLEYEQISRAARPPAAAR